jgi:hypothetical protein
MGRLKKYNTPEEKAAYHRSQSNKYYWKNKEQEDEKARKRYQNRNLQNNKSNK